MDQQEAGRSEKHRVRSIPVLALFLGIRKGLGRKEDWKQSRYASTAGPSPA